MSDAVLDKEAQVDAFHAVSRPTDEEIGNLPANVVAYMEHLENRTELLAAELEAKPGAEARGIVWFNVFSLGKDPNTGDIKFVTGSITSRSDVDAIYAFDEAYAAINHAMGKKVYPFQVSPPALPRVEPERQPASGGNGQGRGRGQSQPEPEPEQPPKRGRGRGRGRGQAQQEPSNGPQEDDTPNPYHAVMLKVTPRADSRADVEFFGNDKKSPRNQYPTLAIKNWKVEDLLKIFPEDKEQPWTEADFSVAAEIDLDADVVWEYGDTKPGSDKRYKDVVAVQYA